MNKNFLVVSKDDMQKRNIKQLDYIIVSGDAYIDHSSFGSAIIGRYVESLGYTVGIIAQPDWKDINAFKALGRPKYAFLVNSGNIDSMVCHYTASKKKRNDDAYTPGGKAGKRPDRAVIVYCNMIRQAYKKMNIIIGGIEASLRRFAHYDYWDNKVRRSILLDSTANMLIYGNGERPLKEITNRLSGGENLSDITNIKGTSYIKTELSENDKEDAVTLPSFKEVSTSKQKYNEAFKIQYTNQDSITGKKLIQFMEKEYIITNPPANPLSREELDAVYELPYMRKPHPMYKEHIPATEEVQFSVTSNRGCFGNCSFCALKFHQGRVVHSRNKDSIIREVKLLTKQENFKGYIHDVGGPTANFRNPACKNQEKNGTCIKVNKNCLSPVPCKNLEVSHKELIDVLDSARKVEGVKKVFIRSGIRYDYLLYEKDEAVMKKLIKNHISGQLKIAPEHINKRTLNLMGKPGKDVYNKFVEKYEKINKELGMKQYIVPYFMSSHPGCDLSGAIELTLYLREKGIRPRQVQDFYPTPGTLSTTIFYTGINPLTGEKVYVPKSYEEKQMQRALIQYYKPENKNLLRTALKKAKREDLIGNGPYCLVSSYDGGQRNRPESWKKKTTFKNKKRKPKLDRNNKKKRNKK